jgi:hypothetical protein
VWLGPRGKVVVAKNSKARKSHGGSAAERKKLELGQFLIILQGSHGEGCLCSQLPASKRGKVSRSLVESKLLP